MLQELKIRISNHQEIENKLKDLGAAFIEGTSFTDTYFNQPDGKVRKISEGSNFSSLVNLISIDGRFEITSNQKLDDVEKIKQDLTHQLDIKSVLKGKRRKFKLDDLKVTLNLIEGIGEFLILTGDNPTEDFITEELGLKNPDYIRVSFDELKKI